MYYLCAARGATKENAKKCGVYQAPLSMVVGPSSAAKEVDLQKNVAVLSDAQAQRSA
ncbi:MAG: hypothetical protein KDA42_13520 [Planctomycetales bacterium]|nr:hypothetical protein [Planctomycetales bacterium]